MIQGRSIKRIPPKYLFRDSNFPKVCEIEVLSQLENHHKNEKNDLWELHLFLPENVSGFNIHVFYPNLIIQLEKLNVKSNQLWEFCDYETNNSLYKPLFPKIVTMLEVKYRRPPLFCVDWGMFLCKVVRSVPRI